MNEEHILYRLDALQEKVDSMQVLQNELIKIENKRQLFPNFIKGCASLTLLIIGVSAFTYSIIRWIERII